MADNPEVKKTDGPKLQSRKIIPKYSMPQRNPNTPTLAADFAVALGDVDAHQCTLTFFRNHPTMKYGDKNFIFLEGVEQEPFLEVKMPLDTAMALALYLVAALEEIRGAAPDKRGFTFFGPSGFTAQ